MDMRKTRSICPGVELQSVEDSVIHELKIRSRIVHSLEVDKIPFFIRQAPDSDTRLGVLWKKKENACYTHLYEIGSNARF